MSLKSVINVMMATAIAYAALLILMLVINFISLQSADPEQYLGMFAYVAFYSGALICGFINAKVGASGGITAGIAAGLVYIGVLYLVSLLFEGDRGFLERLVINLTAVIVAGMGGYFGAYKKPKQVSPAKSREAVRKKYMTKRA